MFVGFTVIFALMAKLTVKQEKFVNRYLECGNASEAYRYAYDCSKMTDKSVWESASSLLSDVKVASRVKELQNVMQSKSDITKEGNLAILHSIMSNEAESPSVRIKAIEVANKMLGFDAPEKKELTGKDGGAIQVRGDIEHHRVVFEHYRE